MEGIATRVAQVRDRIASAGGDPALITLVAVTKGFGPECVAAAVDAGVGDFGENYAQELVAKADPAATSGNSGARRWHFLGAVQRRRVATLAPLVDVWQSVDRLVAGQEIARRVPGAQVLVQVNVSERPGRPGCTWSQAPGLVEGLREEGLDVRGLMAVGSPGTPGREFRRLGELRGALGLEELSMGMSGDLEVAVEAGSTMVRVGRALFGPRPERADLRGYSHPRGGS